MVSTRREIIIENNLGLVHAFARRFIGRGIEYDDLYSAGCIGLCKAARAYDPERGTAFSTYAVPVILGEIKRLFRDDGTVKVSRRLKEIYLKAARERDIFSNRYLREPTVSELAEIIGISCEETAEALAAGVPALSLTQGGDENDGDEFELPAVSFEDDLIVRVSLEDALGILDPCDRKLIVMRYINSMSQQATADILGMSQVQVSRRERKILGMMRQKLA